MDTESNRIAERPTGRGSLAEYDPGFDRLATDRGERDAPEAAPVDGVRWAVAADGDRSERSDRGLDAVAEIVAASARELAVPLQSPERFVETDRGRQVFGPD